MKKLVLLSILLTLLLMACGTNSASEAPDEVAQADTANTEVDQTSEADTDDAATTATDTPVSESTAAEAPATTPSDSEATLASCNVDPLGLPKNEAIANISSVDWLKNEATPETITIVEYGDFQ